MNRSTVLHHAITTATRASLRLKSDTYLTNYCELSVSATPGLTVDYSLPKDRHQRHDTPRLATSLYSRTEHISIGPHSGPSLSTNHIMCYHKYTHYSHCNNHIPMHTHMCPKNITEDQTRVIFCEDYQAVRVEAKADCPHCDVHQHRSATTPTSSTGRQGYPTPPKTATPGSTR